MIVLFWRVKLFIFSCMMHWLRGSFLVWKSRYLLPVSVQHRSLQVQLQKSAHSLYSPNTLLKAIFATALTLRTKGLQLSLSTSETEKKGYFRSPFFLLSLIEVLQESTPLKQFFPPSSCQQHKCVESLLLLLFKQAITGLEYTHFTQAAPKKTVNYDKLTRMRF